jgi:hypothetical protein
MSRLESWFEVEALGSTRSFSAIGSPLLDMDLLWYTPYGEQMSMCKKLTVGETLQEKVADIWFSESGV